jgi:hypothetical protein
MSTPYFLPKQVTMVMIMMIVLYVAAVCQWTTASAAADIDIQRNCIKAGI